MAETGSAYSRLRRAAEIVERLKIGRALVYRALAA